MSDTNIAEINQSTKMPADTSTAGMLFNPQALAQVEHFAVQMAKGKSTIPAHLQGSPADCMAVIFQAMQWGMSPHAVAQKTHLVNGTLGYEAQLVNAVVSSSKAIKGRFRYEWDGEGNTRACRAGAVLAGEQAITWGAWVKYADQTVKNSPLWKTDPSQQLAYLAVKKWARLYTPDVILGVYTPDELEEIDMGQAVVVTDEPQASRTQSVKEKLKAKQAEAQPAELIEPETGELIPAPTYDEVIAALGNCRTPELFAEIRDTARSIYDDCSKEEKAMLTKSIKALEEEFGE